MLIGKEHFLEMILFFYPTHRKRTFHLDIQASVLTPAFSRIGIVLRRDLLLFYIHSLKNKKKNKTRDDNPFEMTNMQRLSATN